MTLKKKLFSIAKPPQKQLSEEVPGSDGGGIVIRPWKPALVAREDRSVKVLGTIGGTDFSGQFRIPRRDPLEPVDPPARDGRKRPS